MLSPSDGGASDPTNDVFTAVLGSKINLLGLWGGDVYAPYNGTVAPPTPSAVPPNYKGDNPDPAWPKLPYWRNPTVGYDGSNTNVDYTGGVTFQLQVLNSKSQYVPVQTIGPFSGTLAGPESNSMITQGAATYYGLGNVYSYDFYKSSTDLGEYFALPDPRTTRFAAGEDQAQLGASITSGDLVLNSAFPENVPFNFGNVSQSNALHVWTPTDEGSGPIQNAGINKNINRGMAMGQLWRNVVNSTAGVNTWYADRGAQGPRVGDTYPNGAKDPYPAELTPMADPVIRPIILKRPFKSVAELGYVSRDLPWKSLNFSQDQASANNQPTADAGLLDVFSLTEAPVRAGVINLNTASSSVISSLAAGTNLNPTLSATATSGSDTIASLGSNDVTTLGSQWSSYIGTRGAPNAILESAGDLTTAIQSGKFAPAAWSKPKREAVIAALADVHNARTWNVLIDVYAQAGRFPTAAAGTLDKFQTTGQKHLWIEAAIDRYTGKVVDEVVEQPDEESSLH